MRHGFLNNFGRNPRRHDVVQSATCTSRLAGDVAIATTSLGRGTSRKSLENVCRDFDVVFDSGEGLRARRFDVGRHPAAVSARARASPTPRSARATAARCTLHACAPGFTKGHYKSFCKQAAFRQPTEMRPMLTRGRGGRELGASTLTQVRCGSAHHDFFPGCTSLPRG